MPSYRWGHDLEMTEKLEKLNKEPHPGTGPPERLFIPEAIQSIALVHTSNFSCHPGANRMVSFAKRLFWWPTMNDDIKEFVAACPTCAHNKSNDQPPVEVL